MARSEPATSTLLADRVASELSIHGDERSFELLRLSVDPVLLNAFVNRAETIDVTSRTSVQPSDTIPFLAVKPVAGTGTGRASDRFRVEPLHARSVRPEVFNPFEDEERPEFCEQAAFGFQGATVPILIFAMVTILCLVGPWLWSIWSM